MSKFLTNINELRDNVVILKCVLCKFLISRSFYRVEKCMDSAKTNFFVPTRC